MNHSPKFVIDRLCKNTPELIPLDWGRKQAEAFGVTFLRTGKKQERQGKWLWIKNETVNNHMNSTSHHDERIAKMSFASVYPHYLAKVEKKGRTREELHEVIEWLTGFNEAKVLQLMEEKASFEQFFQQASLHPNAHLITGLICGYRVEAIENPLTQQVRYLDKLVDELAKEE